MAIERMTIARPYAEAAFQQAREEGTVTDWERAIELLSILVQDSAVAQRIAHPGVDRSDLERLLLDVGAEVDPEIFAGTRGNFMRVLLENRRLGYAPEIFMLFHTLRAEEEKRLDVEVISALALDADAEAAIATTLQQQRGKQVVIRSRVDPELIGGVMVKVGDQVIDLSLQGRLEQLRGRLQG